MRRTANRAALQALQLRYRAYPDARALHARAPMRQPPVLLISLPRSGSTWIGSVLGDSPDAAYLNEPLNASYEPGEDRPTIFPIEADAPAAAYRDAADKAFLGLPRFPLSVVHHPQQWTVRARSKKRVVIKEVNPLALQWLARQFTPKDKI